MSAARATLATLIGVAGLAVSVAMQQSAVHRLDLAASGATELLYLVIGLLILHGNPAHAVGRLAVVGPLIAMTGTAVLEVSVRRLADHPHEWPTLLAATLGTTGRGVGWLALVLLVPLVFPEGRPTGPPRLVSGAKGAAYAALSLALVSAMFSPTQTDLRIQRLDNPIGLPRAVNGPFQAVSLLMILVAVPAICLAAGCVISRWRHGSALRRQQLMWFGLSFVPPIAMFGTVFTDSGQPWMFGLATLPVPVAIGVAMFQKQLYDVQLAVNRSLTYGLLSVAVAAVYALTVGGVGSSLQVQGAPWLPWLAAGVVAVSFAPLRDALQRLANRVTYGQWAQPAEVLARTRRRLADAGDLRGLLGSLAAELAEGLGLGFVELRDQAGAVVATHGIEPDQIDQLPLTAYAGTVGTLRWTRRPLRERDRALLTDLAAQLGAVLHAEELLGRVRAAQERLVLAREEERRRLRRDLHDGLGPALAGLTLQVDTLRNQLDAPLAESALLALRGGIQDAVVDVRRIVEGLRPPALDDLGLVEALRHLAERTSASTLTVSVAAGVLPKLPAATEVAAYRIAAEALGNVTRHAGADLAIVTLRLENGCLCLEVSDNGNGAAAPRPEGVGLGSMRQRAEEIGGTFAIRAQAGRGTTIVAGLPVPKGADA